MTETSWFTIVPSNVLFYWLYWNFGVITRNLVQYIVANRSRTPSGSLPMSWPAVRLETYSYFRCDGR